MKNIPILLSKIQGPANLGLIMRAMANTGFKEVRFTGELNGDEFDVKRYALKSSAMTVVKKMPSLAEMTSDLHTVVGLTTKTPWMDNKNVLYSDFVNLVRDEMSAGKRVGLLFGNEEAGLSNSELARCTYRLSLPTNKSFTSLNIAQAAMIVMWQIHTNLLDKDDLNIDAKVEIATNKNKELLLGKLQDLLITINYLKAQNRERMWEEMLNALQHKSINERELNICTGMISKCLAYIESLKEDIKHGK